MKSVAVSKGSMAALLFLALSSTLVSPVVVAAAKELSGEELRQIQGKMKATESLSVDFTQKNYKKMRGQETKREGRAIFRKPSSFKWMLEKPLRHYSIFDGKNFFEYTPDAKSAVRYQASDPQSADLQQVVDLVLNFDSLLKRYDVAKASQDGDLVKIELQPKTAGDIVGIDLDIHVKDSFIGFLKLKMKSGNYLAHTFRNPSRAAVSADTFVLPVGVKVKDNL